MNALSRMNMIMNIVTDITNTLDNELVNCEAKDVEAKIRNTFKEMAKKRHLDRLMKNILIPQKPISRIIEDKGIKIYCDGGCSSGGSGSGVVVYINNKPPIKYYGGYKADGTNNTAELTALKEALIKADDLHVDGVISIMSDSRYSIDAITNWSYSWKRNGWAKRKGIIKNLELIQETHELYHNIKNKVKVSWVKGHSKIEGNELADQMATLAIKKKQKDFVILR